MNINQWEDARVLSLPDYAFGRRQLVQLYIKNDGLADKYAIATVGLPDKCVIWEATALCTGTVTNIAFFELAWADRLPASSAEWSRLTKIFPYAGVQDGLDWGMVLSGNNHWHVNQLRLAGSAAGLRPALRIDFGSTQNAAVIASLVVSGWPTEIPDWIGSGWEEARRPSASIRT